LEQDYKVNHCRHFKSRWSN